MIGYQVLVVGAGPVGLTLSIDLARRGIRVLLIEMKSDPRKWPKMERCNARTMEIYRRLGLSETMRAASKFRDVPMDVFCVHDLSAPPLLHLHYPSVTDFKTICADAEDGSQPAEPYQLISQYTLEPILKARAEAMPEIDVRYGWKLDHFSQGENQVVAEISTERGGRETIVTPYMVGTDGGTSTVRKQLGVKLEGEGRLVTLRQMFFRSEKLFDAIPVGKGRHYYFPVETLVVQDDLQHFALHSSDPRDEPAENAIRRRLGLDVDVEVLNDALWNQNLLIAEEYGQGRVLMAGDAVRLVIPTGGLGLNTGIGDAIDLSWKLAGTIQGWAGPRALRSYQSERRPVGLRNREASGRAARGVMKWRAVCTVEIGDDSAAGAAARQRASAAAAIGQTYGHEMNGVELGYQYVGSPLGYDEPGAAPPLHDLTYSPSTAPGLRLPNMWLEPGVAIQDRLGFGYVLLRLAGDRHDTGALEAAMRETGAPFEVFTSHDPALREVYERDLLLLRPDLHVAWRGNAPPAAPSAVAARVTGQEAA